MKLLPNLNPLRFFLALLVMLFHIPQFFSNRLLPFFDSYPIFHKGQEAVYVFFVLSGFLIIRALYIEKSTTGSINIKNFYIRRVLRILPLYIFILLSGILYYNFFLKLIGIYYVADYDVANTVLLCLFFLPNVAAKLYHPGGIIEVLWSIGIEEQFYIIIAPILAYLRANFFVKVLFYFSVFYFLLVASSFFPILKKYDFFYFYFSFGGLLAVLNEKYKIHLLINKYLKLFLFILFIIYFTTTFFSAFSFISYHLITMIVIGFFILSISFNPIYKIENKFIDYLGKISYGIYMFHSIVMQLVGFILLKLKNMIVLSNITLIILSYFLVILITIITSHLSYQYFEKYFLKQKIKYRK
jgi:peptidoglycan/LPS O-acetylase OafA/YrhL